MSLLRPVWLAMPVLVMRVPSDRDNAAGAARFATPCRPARRPSARVSWTPSALMRQRPWFSPFVFLLSKLAPLFGEP